MSTSKAKTKEAAAYQQHVKEKAPKSNTVSQCLRAFLVGGLICCVGQLIKDYGSNALGLNEDLTAALTAITLVFLGALFTGLGVYDKLGSWAGAGSVVPITGFANSIVAPAMEFKREGLVLGTAAKMFTIAGPVLVYGIGSSILVGLIYCLISGL